MPQACVQRCSKRLLQHLPHATCAAAHSFELFCRIELGSGGYKYARDDAVNPHAIDW